MNKITDRESITSVFTKNLEEHLIIYPNPTKELLKVETKNMEGGRIGIFNSLGEAYLLENFSGKYFEKNIADFPSDIYYILLENEGKRISRKIIKI